VSMHRDDYSVDYLCNDCFVTILAVIKGQILLWCLLPPSTNKF